MINDVYIDQSLDSVGYSLENEPFFVQVPLLEQVLEDIDSLPAYSLLLGLCEDGLPLVVDLTDPAPGAVLISSDDHDANFNLLYSLLTAAYTVNTPDEINLHFISPYADELTHLHRQPHFKISFTPDRAECEVMIEEMVNLVHKRQGTHDIQPIHILAIDGLDLLLDSLSPEARLWFNWLVEYGPQSGVWVIAAVEAPSIKKAYYHIIDGFPSRVLGQIRFPRLARYLSGLSRGSLDDLAPGAQFLVRTGGDTFKLWMLHPEE